MIDIVACIVGQYHVHVWPIIDNNNSQLHFRKTFIIRQSNRSYITVHFSNWSANLVLKSQTESESWQGSKHSLLQPAQFSASCLTSLLRAWKKNVDVIQGPGSGNATVAMAKRQKFLQQQQRRRHMSTRRPQTSAKASIINSFWHPLACVAVDVLLAHWRLWCCDLPAALASTVRHPCAASRSLSNDALYLHNTHNRPV